MHCTKGWRRAFTLIELVAVIVILAILAGVALPRYYSYQANAREAATRGTLGGVRAGIANFYANTAITGTAAYPTLVQVTDGSVMQDTIPENPYDGNNTVNAVTQVQSAARTVVAGGGWAYYDGSSGGQAVFYANTNTTGENAW
jgi:MSHA pilin protein MshA